jgi:molecular chaperone IbpA
MTGLNINHLTPFTVGFDRMLDRFEVLTDQMNRTGGSGFPPYNIRRDADEFYIDIALAGLDQDDVEIVVENGTLTIRSTWDEQGDYFNAGGEILHRGISFRKFTRKFDIADDIEVKGAEFVNGLLTVHLERVVPEEKKPKKIEIGNTKKLLKG